MQLTNCTIIGIAGASGAGKSRLAQQLHDRIAQLGKAGDIRVLHEDNYYLPQSGLDLRQRSQVNYDHPQALEHSLLANHLQQLRRGFSVQVPQYDYAQHTRRPDTEMLSPSRLLIVEGILVLHDPELRQHFDLKIFVDVPLDICLTRRLRRDIQQRGRSLESVLQQYEATVRPMYHQFIQPSKAHANLIVPEGGHNNIALDVLHRYLHQLLT
jgi:uridine kinase